MLGVKSQSSLWTQRQTTKISNYTGNMFANVSPPYRLSFLLLKINNSDRTTKKRVRNRIKQLRFRVFDENR